MLSLLPVQVVAVMAGLQAPPVEVEIFDVNHRETRTFALSLTGDILPSDAPNAGDAEALKHILRCKRTEREHALVPGMVAMIADVGRTYEGHTLELVSAFRTHAAESKTSPHRAGRAFDFRVRGVNTLKVRDYLWKHHRGIGVGWYPDRDFVHMDPRPQDIAWTFDRGDNVYNPGWAARVRTDEPARASRREARRPSV